MNIELRPTTRRKKRNEVPAAIITASVVGLLFMGISYAGFVVNNQPVQATPAPEPRGEIEAPTDGESETIVEELRGALALYDSDPEVRAKVDAEAARRNMSIDQLRAVLNAFSEGADVAICPTCQGKGMVKVEVRQ